jgi:SAM-dependent methyltransferase
MTPGPSIPFDRAAAYYDETRGLSAAGMRRTIATLARECEGRGRVLEIGVGTGQVALPLLDCGVDVVGLDLSRPMLDRLVQKLGPDRWIPLVQGDATQLPFAPAAFGLAYLRWVLHLIPAWMSAIEELVRVIRPEGAILVSQGTLGEGPRREIQRRFVEVAGIPDAPAGLDWGDWTALDEAMERLGGRPRALPTHGDIERYGADAFMEALEQDRHSWTWPLPEATRLRAAAEVRAWAEARFGPLDQVPRQRYEVVWRAYDLS